MISILSGDELLWSEFDGELDALVEATGAADRSYMEGRGMSLASMAVGSAATRLSKVRAATEARDLKKTKAAVDKAIPKIREAAFASSGDPENVALEGNLATLSALLAVLKQIEEAAGEAGEAGNTGSNSGTSVTATADKGQEKDVGAGEQQNSSKEKVQEIRQDKTQESTQESRQESKQETRQETTQETGKDKTNAVNQGANEELTHKEATRDDGARLQAVGGLGGDLGVVEPDDDPLSCLADEEGGTGGGRGGRPPMRPLVAPVDSKLAEKESKLYWGKKAWARDMRNVAASKYALASRSLIGEGRQYIRDLNEALLALIEGCAKKSPPESLAGTELAAAAAAAAAAGNNSVGTETAENGKPKEAAVGTGALDQGIHEENIPPPPSLDLVETLRMHVWQGSKEALWPRLSLAYALEEQGESFAALGRFPASCAVYAEASALFESCAVILPMQPEYLLRQWVTARRALEASAFFRELCGDVAVASQREYLQRQWAAAQRALEAGSTGPKPDIKALRRCVKLCIRGAGNDVQGSAEDHPASSASCGSGQVCYEAHLELAGALLERGQFERCTEICGHVLAEHDTDDDEALYSMAEALEALGRSQESMEYAERATPLPLDAD